MNPLPQGDDTAMTDIERLQRLCLDDVPHLSHPWRRSEWTYATNGRSVIAVKRHFNEVPDEPPEPQHDQNAPPSPAGADVCGGSSVESATSA